MNELQVFNFDGNEVRTVLIDNEPYFVGRDVSVVLGFKDSVNALKQHVESEDKIVGCQNTTPSFKDKLGRKQYPTLINESGVYALIFGSTLPQAKKFKRWVTKEVLPNIRKHGAYMTEQTLEKALANPDFLIKLATELKEEQEKRKELETENNVMKPKALFADAVSASQDSILIGQLAKLIRQNGYEIGQNRLFAWLRENGFLCSKGENYNMPTQKSMDMKLMEIKERTVNNPDGSVRITKTTKVTGKGQIYFVNKFSDIVSQTQEGDKRE